VPPQAESARLAMTKIANRKNRGFFFMSGNSPFGFVSSSEYVAKFKI
jgi:hypothetical protein